MSTAVIQENFYEIFPELVQVPSVDKGFFTEKLMMDFVSAIEPHHVLLAEDNQAMRELLAFSLKNKGYQVTECKDGHELLEHLSSFVLMNNNEDFDLIVSDVKMPGSSGLQILEGIHDHIAFPPVVLMSAFGDKETHSKADELGVAAFFDKPFEVENLLDKIGDILQPKLFSLGKPAKTEEVQGYPLDITFNGLDEIPFPIEMLVLKHGSKLKSYSEYIESCKFNIVKNCDGEFQISCLTHLNPNKVHHQGDHVIRIDESDSNPFHAIKTVYKKVKNNLKKMVKEEVVSSKSNPVQR